LGLLLAGLVLVTACTGKASPEDRRSVAPGAGGCPAASGDGGLQRVAVLAGSGPENAAEVTGLAAGGAGAPWLAVGAVRSGGPPPSIGTPATGGEGQGPMAASAGGTLTPAVWASEDGTRWTRARVEPVTLDGAVDRLLGVSR
jgi:hypothetical protein